MTSPPEDVTHEYFQLKTREKAFIKTLSPTHQAFYKVGAVPRDGWPMWGLTDSIFPPIEEAMLILMCEIADATPSISGKRDRAQARETE